HSRLGEPALGCTRTENTLPATVTRCRYAASPGRTAPGGMSGSDPTSPLALGDRCLPLPPFPPFPPLPFRGSTAPVNDRLRPRWYGTNVTLAWGRSAMASAMRFDVR